MAHSVEGTVRPRCRESGDKRTRSRHQIHANDPTETWAAQDVRNAKSIVRSFAKA